VQLTIDDNFATFSRFFFHDCFLSISFQTLFDYPFFISSPPPVTNAYTNMTPTSPTPTTTFNQHDEALSVATFLAGISAYETIIPSLANAPADTEAKATPRCHPCAPAAAAAAADFESATCKGEGQQQQSPSKRAKA
jgi:hypothetical protein